MSGSVHTWNCGTPRSQSNVFNWFTPKDRAKEERDELRKAKDRARKAKGRQKSAKQIAIARVTRVNPESNIAYSTGKTNSEKAPR